jgi:hypothetical protein
MMMVVKARVAGGPILIVKGRDAWALLQLHVANEKGCSPIDHPGPALERLCPQAAQRRRDHPGKSRRSLRRPARALCASQPGNYFRNGRRQIVITGPQIVAGGVSAPHALTPFFPISRTITNVVPGFLGAGDAETP